MHYNIILTPNAEEINEKYNLLHPHAENIRCLSANLESELSIEYTEEDDFEGWEGDEWILNKCKKIKELCSEIEKIVGKLKNAE